MGQVLNYWEYPLYSKLRTYDWENMSNALTNYSTNEQIDAVAHLLADCGKLANTNYCSAEICGSETYTLNIRNSLVSDFNYSSEADYRIRKLTTNWREKLRNNLDVGCPIIYEGHNKTSGHLFICVGYDYDNIDLFHFNYGWGWGSNNYYYIDSLGSDFNNNQKAIFNLYPANYFGCDEIIDLGEFYQQHIYYLSMLIVPVAFEVLTATKDYPVEYRTINNSESVSIKAYSQVRLRSGFHVEKGAKFRASLTDCPQSKEVKINTKTLETLSELRTSNLEVHPNPFTNSITINYTVSETGLTSIKIYNLYGQLQTTVLNEYKTQGEYVLGYNLSQLPIGLYICIMQNGNNLVVTKMS